MRWLWKSIGVVLLLLLPGAAQEPRLNLFVGFSFQRADVVAGRPSNWSGWQVTFEDALRKRLGLVLDFSGNYGSIMVGLPPIPICPITPCPLPPSVTIHEREYHYLFGPRISQPVKRTRVFAHGLLGAATLTAPVGSVTNLVVTNNALATDLGGGLDYSLDQGGWYAWRTQVDYLGVRRFGSWRNDVRVSTGIVLRF